MKFLWHRKISYLFLLLLVISWLYPTYFISDDWEHLDSIYKNGSNVYIKFWIFRIPTLYFFHTRLFPLFQSEMFILANLVCWLPYFLGVLIILEVFGFLEKLKEEPTWFFLAFFIMLCFNHNNFEFIFWPSFMVNFPGFLMIAIGLYVAKTYASWWAQILRTILWVVGFFSTESFFFMGVLLEIAYAIWKLKDDSIKEKIIYLVRQLALPFVVLVIVKGTLTYLKPYGYAAAFGFKPHLLNQVLALIFVHDYYKVRWLTGGLAFLSYILLFAFYFKKIDKKDILQKVIPYIFIVLLSTSYYFWIMDYSARRAIGGQLFITWGSFCLIYYFLWKSKDKGFLRKCVLVLFPLCWLAHSVYVINLKVGDRVAFRLNAAEIRKRMNAGEVPTKISRENIMKGVNTGWNLVNKKQTSGWVRHFFKEEELSKLSY